MTARRIVVIGAGPAGVFAAIEIIEHAVHLAVAAPSSTLALTLPWAHGAAQASVGKAAEDQSPAGQGLFVLRIRH